MPSRPGIILSGALVKVYINNKLYKEAQSVNWTIDYGEREIYGIDSPYAQEISTTRAAIRGNIQGIRIQYSGGLQGYNARAAIRDILSSPYISIRIEDRKNKEDLLLVENAKITRQEYSIAAKGVVRLSFEFAGLAPLEPLDRA